MQGKTAMNSIRNISLSQLCGIISDALYSQLSSTYWVRAEISELRVNNHAYFELVEKSSDTGLFSAKVRATCWANTYNLLSEYFYVQTGQNLKVGMQVLVEVEVVYHAVYGLSLNICNIDPQYTLGDLARARQATIEHLKNDGVFDMQQSLSLPSVIKNIAVVSSASAAGYQDFCHQIDNNPSRLPFRYTLFPAIMQGDGAEQSIISAMQLIFDKAGEFDAVVIIRGGGAATDMSCFDSYPLASVCAQFPLPVITGIGHTRDVSVVDMVAYKSLKTPTAVAEMLIGHNELQLTLLNDLSTRLAVAIQRYIDSAAQRIDYCRKRLMMLSDMYVQRKLSSLQLIEEKIELHSPQVIFSRGYTLTKLNGKVVTSATDVNPSDIITTETADGIFTSEVL